VTEAEIESRRPAVIAAALAKAKDSGEEMFMGLPDRWYEEGPKWRCDNGHILTMYIKSERHGPICSCGAGIWLTFPEDEEKP
jgi:rubrerythrin